MPPTDHVMYERGVRVTPIAARQRSAKSSSPISIARGNISRRTRKRQTTRFRVSLQRFKGQRVAYIAYPIFTAIAQHGNFPYRLLVRCNIIDRLLPDPLLRVRRIRPAPKPAVTRAEGNRTIVHLLPIRAGTSGPKELDLIPEDVVPLFDLPLSLKRDRAAAESLSRPRK